MSAGTPEPLVEGGLESDFPVGGRGERGNGEKGTTPFVLVGWVKMDEVECKI
jgi:hypothetical protein